MKFLHLKEKVNSLIPGERITVTSNQEKSSLMSDALEEIGRLKKENTSFREKLDEKYAGKEPVPVSEPLIGGADELFPLLTDKSSPQEKMALFRSLFRGRDDVYAKYWVSSNTGKKGYSPASNEPWTGKKGTPRTYLPLNNDVIRSHLLGDITIGVYPLLKNSTCAFLVCDFDKEGWLLDAVAYLNMCSEVNVPAYLERSRSGNGGHVWIFFSRFVPAVSVRQLGMRILRKTMDARADLDLGSYDRFFPSQDFTPKGGFGNLIALPLQKKCRALGNTEFIDTSTAAFLPFKDQWAFLSHVLRISPDQLDALLEVVPQVSIGPGKQEVVTSSFREKHPPPAEIRCEMAASFSIEKSGIPPWMLSKLKHMASLHNPEFYLKEKLRLSTYRIPRFIKCFREDFAFLHMPRGTAEEILDLFDEVGSKANVVDQRTLPKKISLKFSGSLRANQKKAIKILLADDMGVLVAPPGAGKTVMGCFAIARRNLPTLVLAHRKPILEQWRNQVMTLLNLRKKDVGQIGGGRNRQSGIVDLVMIQSLSKMENLAALFSQYGFIVVDECHHIPASTFEACIRQAPIKYILGLTATPIRRDGLQDLIPMQCGSIRFRMEESTSQISKRLIVRDTNTTFPYKSDTSIQDVFRSLIEDKERNGMIVKDVLSALSEGKRCLILSQWTKHCQELSEKLKDAGKEVVTFSGTQGKKERQALLTKIQETRTNQDLIVIATGQYLGEGFDCPQLDTLFLAFPVSFKGKVVQFAGRIMREHPRKTSSTIYDYLDSKIPVLKKMGNRRAKAYKLLGFELHDENIEPVKMDPTAG